MVLYRWYIHMWIEMISFQKFLNRFCSKLVNGFEKLQNHGHLACTWGPWENFLDEQKEYIFIYIFNIKKSCQNLIRGGQRINQKPAQLKLYLFCPLILINTNFLFHLKFNSRHFLMVLHQKPTGFLRKFLRKTYDYN